MADTISTARAAAEVTLGFCIPDHIAEEVLAYAKRKCDLNRKPESYLPLLHENELTDYYMWLAINLRGGMSNVHDLRAIPVRQPVSKRPRPAGGLHLRPLWGAYRSRR